MEDKKIKFRWSDAWLLLSIAEATKNRPAELWEIIAMGDIISHAIFTYSEIRSGLYHLWVNRWIIKRGNRFIVSEKYKKVIEPKLSGSHYTRLEKIEKILQVKPYETKEKVLHAENNLKYLRISKESFERAVKKYYNEFSNIYKDKNK